MTHVDDTSLKDYKDRKFEEYVEKFNKDSEDSFILAMNELKRKMGIVEDDSVCILCTRACPMRSDGIIECRFVKDGGGTW